MVIDGSSRLGSQAILAFTLLCSRPVPFIGLGLLLLSLHELEDLLAVEVLERLVAQKHLFLMPDSLLLGHADQVTEPEVGRLLLVFALADADEGGGGGLPPPDEHELCGDAGHGTSASEGLFDQEGDVSGCDGHLETDADVGAASFDHAHHLLLAGLDVGEDGLVHLVASLGGLVVHWVA